MSYEPKPLDTSNVKLPAFLDELTERLAKNVHEVWAQERLKEGWRLGPERDGATREHPNLLPFEDLPEFEKDYDRRTAIETLKMIVALGYTIHPPS